MATASGTTLSTAIGLDRVDILIAIEEIKLLKSRYFQAVDEKDYPTITDLFTADATIDFSGEAQYHVGHNGVTEKDFDPDRWIVTGGADATTVISGAVQDIITAHQGHDPQIVLTGSDTATGRWTLYDRLEFEQETMHGYGHYRDTYLRQDGVWRMSSLILTRVRVAWVPTSSSS